MMQLALVSLTQERGNYFEVEGGGGGANVSRGPR